MNKDGIDISVFTDHLECFGNFKRENTVCKTYCAINMRCAIEREQNDRFEILQDLAFSDDLYLRIQ